MNKGNINFHEDELFKIQMLKSIYLHESMKLSGPSSFHSDINDVMWTLDDLKESLSLDQEQFGKISSLIDELHRKNHLMKVDKKGCTKYVSRVAEIVRLLGHNYEYWYNGRPGIEATRWIIEDKVVPERNIDADDFLSKLKECTKKLSRGSKELDLAIDMVVKGVSKELSRTGDWRGTRFSDFQLRSTLEMLRSQYTTGYENSSQILTAGVGSGKTIGFILATFISAVESKLSGEDQKRTHLILYPRTALAKDQFFSSISKFASGIGLGSGDNLNVHLEHRDYYMNTGENNIFADSDQPSVKKGVEKVYRINSSLNPDIIITTLETLKRRLQIPEFVKYVSRYLERVIVDEIHLIEGLTGAQVIQLMNRLRSACKKDLLWTGSSATVASPDEHASKIFNIDSKKITIIEPNQTMKQFGLVHHVFLKPSGLVNPMGTLINSTSLLVHSRRYQVGNRSKNVSDLQKTIGFADNLDLLGRWNADLRENERTEAAWSDIIPRPHPKYKDPFQWGKERDNPSIGEKMREVPYALRFSNPLTRRIKAKPGETKGKNEPYKPVLQDIGIDNPCERCMNGERIILKKKEDVTKEDLERLGRFVVREPTKDDDRVKRFEISNSIFMRDDVDIGTLDLCPYLRAGACSWFPKEDFSIDIIPFTDEADSIPDLYEYKNHARSKIHSSKTKGEVIDESDELSDIVYTGTSEEIYDVNHHPYNTHREPSEKEKELNKRPIEIDIVLASPSLEVGIDLENLTESIMYKAIRNVASYRQKAGRVGRETGSDVMNVTLLSSRNTDFHFYRQPRKLTSLAQLDPIPLSRDNKSIMMSGLYMGIWDHLALYANLPEVIPLNFKFTGKGTSFSTRLTKTLEYIERNEGQIREYLRELSGYRLKKHDELINGALDQVKRDLKILLTPAQKAFEGGKIEYLAGIVIDFLKNRGSFSVKWRANVKSEISSIEGATKTYIEELRPQVDPLGMGLEEEFRELDLMADCGWDKERLSKIHDNIESEIKAHGHYHLNGLLEELIDKLERIEAKGISPYLILFKNQLESTFAENKIGKAYYLSYIMEEVPLFKSMKKRAQYVRPKNLFTNPYEEKVDLYRIKKGRKDEREKYPFDAVPLSEALHSFIPGTWTYRLGKDAMKVKIGELNSPQPGSLISDIKNIRDSHNEFRLLQEDLNGPPFTNKKLNIYQPTELTLMRAEKYQVLNKGNLKVVDYDECSEKQKDTSDGDDGGAVKIKVPKNYADRWVHVDHNIETSKTINFLDMYKDKIGIDGIDANVQILDDRIKHPLFKKGIKKVEWHKNLDIVEYVHEISRTYSSKSTSGSDLTYKDGADEAAFGSKMETKGVSIELDEDTLMELVDKVKEGVLCGTEEWVPTGIKALHALLYSTELDEGRIGVFTVEDIISILVSNALSNDDTPTLKDMIEDLNDFAMDKEGFEKVARRFIRNKKIGIIEDIEVDNRQQIDSLDDDELKERVTRDLKKIKSFLGPIVNSIDDLESFIEEWTIQTILNTFGICSINALQRLSGTDDQRLGYYPDYESIDEGIYRIYLYDRDINGNGSNRLLNDYFHILYVQRSKNEKRAKWLPSEDFLEMLEEELLQCPQFHTDINALKIHQEIKNGEEPNGFPELGYIKSHSDEVRDNSEAVWDKIGIDGPEDAWKLPLINMTSETLIDEYKSKGLERDDISRASHICWNGCPECIINDYMLMGPLKGVNYVDKAIMDMWYDIVREGVQEYKGPTSNELIQGIGLEDIGKKSHVYLEDENRGRIRSVSLPYNIGINIDRKNDIDSIKMILRDDNILGLKSEDRGDGVWLNIPIGYGRLVWFNLIMSAYLEAIGKLPEDRKVLNFVFYDIRDIEYKDIGVSQRLLETINHMKREDGFTSSLEKLSDFLGWMIGRGFSINICVDSKRSKEKGVKSFLETVYKHSKGDDNLRIFTKNISKDSDMSSMHSKGLLTPIGAITGSANLTYHGVNKNEESVNYASYGTQGYHDIKIDLTDKISGGIEWTPEE